MDCVVGSWFGTICRAVRDSRGWCDAKGRRTCKWRQECRPIPWTRANPDSATVALDDAPDDAQSKTVSMKSRTVNPLKGFEGAGALAGSKPISLSLTNSTGQLADQHRHLCAVLVARSQGGDGVLHSRRQRGVVRQSSQAHDAGARLRKSWETLRLKLSSPATISRRSSVRSKQVLAIRTLSASTST
jgi:hypothetical protein